MPLTQIKRVCARVSVCLRVIFLLNTQIVVFFLCFCSVHPILYRSTSLSYYLIIMFFFFVRAACANIVSSAINYFKVAIELYILTTNRSVGQRVAMAFDVAKHYLPY